MRALKSLMSKKGLEPSRHKPHEPESCASTNSATSTRIILELASRGGCSLFGEPSRKMILNHFPAAECHFDKDYIGTRVSWRMLFPTTLSSNVTFSHILVGRVPLRHSTSIHILYYKHKIYPHC